MQSHSAWRLVMQVGALWLWSAAAAAEAPRTIDVWPGFAPGESERQPGAPLPRKEGEQPPATRIGGITQPLLEVYEPAPEKRNGAAVLIAPGGGYNYVVQDKEGAEAAAWLNELGVTALVVRYRTKLKSPGSAPVWERPLQDLQRSLSLVRARAAEWRLDPQRIGVLGFSAGGQLAALAATRFEQRSYAAVDDADRASCRPDFVLLLYPWQLVDGQTGALIDALRVTKETPPTFLVHTHDDSATSLSSVQFYAALKQQRVPAELHIYQGGGHGYGLRPVEGAHVHTWPERAAEWLRQSGWLAARAPANDAAAEAAAKPVKALILPGDAFLVAERPAFIFWPPEAQRRRPQPWVFYAPTLPPYPDAHEKWMHEQFLAAGVAVAGIDIGEAYGSPAGRELFTKFYEHVTTQRGLAAQPCLLGRSRGGLWVTSWAASHPDKVAGLAGIYPVFDFRTYPGLAQAAPAYGLSAAELEARAAEFNPIQRVDVLARAKIPAFLIHGDQDQVVPLKENSAEFVARYRAAGAESAVTLIVAAGQGHNFWEGFFRCQGLVDFAIARARAGAALAK